jgi:hypothetical protein
MVPDTHGVIDPFADPSEGVLVYDVQWTSDCIPPVSGGNYYPNTPNPEDSCSANTSWHTILDASSGDWLQSFTDS